MLIAYDPFISEDAIHAGGGESVSIQDLYQWSDFISLHLPYNVHTRDLMGPMAFSEMKDGVRIVCAARGGIIDEAGPARCPELRQGRRGRLGRLRHRAARGNRACQAPTRDLHPPYRRADG